VPLAYARMARSPVSLAMAAGSKVMVSYPVQPGHGDVALDKEIEQKEDGRYIIYYTFEDEED
jgi:hypothetical protein